MKKRFEINKLFAKAKDHAEHQCQQIKDDYQPNISRQLYYKQQRPIFSQASRQIIDFKAYKANNYQHKHKKTYIKPSYVYYQQPKEQNYRSILKEKSIKLQDLYKKFLSKNRQISNSKDNLKPSQQKNVLQIIKNKKQNNKEKAIITRSKTIVFPGNIKDISIQKKCQFDIIKKLEQKIKSKLHSNKKLNLKSKNQNKKLLIVDNVSSHNHSKQKESHFTNKQRSLKKITKSKTIEDKISCNPNISQQSKTLDLCHGKFTLQILNQYNHDGQIDKSKVINTKSLIKKALFSEFQKYNKQSNLLSYDNSLKRKKGQQKGPQYEMNRIEGWQYQHQNTFYIQ